MTTTQALGRWGIYGFAVDGFADPSALLVRVPPSWPRLTVTSDRPDGRSRPTHVEPGRMLLGEDGAEAWLDDRSRIEIHRASLRVVLRTPHQVGDAALAHPYLGLPAAVASHWLGRQVLHGAGFVHRSGAYGVLGGKEAGKSTTVACLLGRGVEVVSDDLLVVDGTTVFTGPRCIDLRPEAAAHIGGHDLGVVGGRPRWRLHGDSAAPDHRLRGFVHLAWGDDVRLDWLPPVERLTALLEHVVFQPDEVGAAACLELAALPAWRFTRPQAIDAIDHAVDQLLAGLDA